MGPRLSKETQWKGYSMARQSAQGFTQVNMSSDPRTLRLYFSFCREL